ncbi:hypothetical protein QAD02_014820 [Eretmocerus hayati]|uniref:Uncharacterized protein n=1 Tax=Eretmocerus hayati TaxID=131215 RepID=A0ACC2P7F1_9HYME|nr:hypothetical protein QAD02_014820 [Eretmocerus hayati]
MITDDAALHHGERRPVKYDDVTTATVVELPSGPFIRNSFDLPYRPKKSRDEPRLEVCRNPLIWSNRLSEDEVKAPGTDPTTTESNMLPVPGSHAEPPKELESIGEETGLLAANEPAKQQ